MIALVAFARPLVDDPGVGRAAFPVAAVLGCGLIVGLVFFYRRVKKAAELERAEDILRAECEAEYEAAARAYEKRRRAD